MKKLILICAFLSLCATTSIYIFKSPAITSQDIDNDIDTITDFLKLKEISESYIKSLLSNLCKSVPPEPDYNEIKLNKEITLIAKNLSDQWFSYNPAIKNTKEVFKKNIDSKTMHCIAKFIKSEGFKNCLQTYNNMKLEFNNKELDKLGYMAAEIEKNKGNHKQTSKILDNNKNMTSKVYKIFKNTNTTELRMIKQFSKSKEYKAFESAIPKIEAELLSQIYKYVTAYTEQLKKEVEKNKNN